MSIKLAGNMLLGLTGSSPLDLSDLNDVSIANPLNNEYLKYNDTTGEWFNSIINSDVLTALTPAQGVTIGLNGNQVQIGLGHITPLSVNTIGTVTAANINGTVSGTNTGDQNSFNDGTFEIVDDVDPTKIAKFQLSGIVGTRTFTLPNLTGSLATIGNIPQIFLGQTSFSHGTVTIGTATGASTYGLGTGATTSGITKTINIGTAGAAGSTTSINIGSVNSGGLITTNQLMILSGNPTQAMGAATKEYVDNLAAGLKAKFECFTATTATLAVSSAGTVTYANGAAGVGATLTTTGNFNNIGGATTANNNRILIKNEANVAHNGIYVRTSATVLTRSTDFDDSPDGEIETGDFTFITTGTLAGTNWVLTTASPITIGTTPLVFSQLSGPGTYTPSTGISITDNAIKNEGVLTITTNTGLSVNASAKGNVTITNTGTRSIVAGTNVALNPVNGVGDVTVSVSGTVDSSSKATIVNDITAAASVYPTWVTTTTGNLPIKVSDTKLSFIPSTGILSATGFAGSGAGLTGTATSLNIGGNAATSTKFQTARTINGVSFDATGDITIKASTTNALTINSGGAGAASPVTFDGGAARTISYNTVGAPSTTGTNASGNWGISITGTSTGVAQTNISSMNTLIFNNSGQIHATNQDFNTVAYGVRYLQGRTNGPGLSTSGDQYYTIGMGVGSDYPDTYGMQFAFPRISSGTPAASPYLMYRQREAAAWGAWGKIYAGYTDSAGSLSGKELPFYFYGWSIDANSMANNSSGFTYASNAPKTGPIANIAGSNYGSYNLQLNAGYTSDGILHWRTHNGDVPGWNTWQSVPNTTGAGASGTWGISVSGTASYAQYLWSTSHSGTYYVSNAWDGTYWKFTSNHGSPVAVGYADSAGNAATVNSYAGRTDGASYPVVWNTTGGTSSNYTCSAVTIKSSEGSLTASELYSNGWFRSNTTGTGWYHAVHAGGIYMNDAVWVKTYNGKGMYADYFGGPVSGSSYGSMRTSGTTGGYAGIFMDSTGGTVGCMTDASGNGGDYDPTTGWHYYWERGNQCLGLGGATVAAGYRAYTNGNHYVAGALYATNNVTAFSDIRVKEDIQLIPDALNKVLAIRGVTYLRNDETDGKRHAGVIAQEVEKVLPEVVSENHEGMKGVAYGNMVGLLIEAVKELNAKVEFLQDKLAKLDNTTG